MGYPPKTLASHFRRLFLDASKTLPNCDEIFVPQFRRLFLDAKRRRVQRVATGFGETFGRLFVAVWKGFVGVERKASELRHEGFVAVWKGFAGVEKEAS